MNPSCCLDDPVHHGETETRAFTDRFRREERFEDPLSHIRANAASGIGEPKPRVPAWRDRGSRWTLGLRQSDVIDLDQEAAAGGHRIARVHGQVERHLLDLRRVRQHGRHVRRDDEPDINVLADDPAEHLHEVA